MLSVTKPSVMLKSGYATLSGNGRGREGGRLECSASLKYSSCKLERQHMAGARCCRCVAETIREQRLPALSDW